ncbi:RNA polymerase sigma factor [Robertkochia solimangrovi]|uniref:RNA polymerase sigma factor n=1 Tax=Robertkochia solimangrovi TaxID=2213046 RepID=UPI00117C1B7B|nr:sigma-70 family RNA polymerase sigma factor [Robertkochia solimangrovi]TRZ41609.1 RNA polymerase subunit sigma-24 [Robertkochia solimangrovi]
MSDNSILIRKLKKADKSAFKTLYFSYYDKLIHMAKRFDFKFLTPEDFIQETFLQVHKNRHQLKEDVLLDKQLFVICRNIILNHLNRENKVIPLQPLHLSDSFEETADTEEESDQEWLLQLIDQLPPQRQLIFRLHKLESYSYDEIATMTNLSHKTIANHIYLANTFLKKKLKKA